MAVEAERLLVAVETQGVDSANRDVRDFGNSAIESATEVDTLGEALDSAVRDSLQLAGSLQTLQGRLSEVDDEFGATDRSASGASRSLSAFASAALAAVGPVTTLNSRLDETDDDLDSVRNSAIGASGAMSGYAGSSLAATAATYSMHDALIAGAIPSLVVLTSTLGPLVGIVGALGAGLLGLAGGFGAVLGSGALAWFQQTENAMEQLKAVQEELVAIAADFGQQFIPLIDSAIAAVPELARRLVAATGDMTPFVNELQRLGSIAMDVLPQILGWFMDIGREALPVWRDFTSWVGQKTPAALEFFRSVVSRTWDSVHNLSLALLDALGTFTEFGVVATNVVAPMLETLLSGFQGLLEWVLQLPPRIRDLTVAGAALAPVFTMGAVAGAELLRILKSLSVTFTTSNTALARLTPAFGTMALALGTVAAAAIALGDVYEENFAGIREATHRVAGVIKDEFLATFRVARSVVGTILGDLTGAIAAFAVSSESDIAGVVNSIENGLVTSIRTLGRVTRSILRGLESAWNAHKNTIGAALIGIAGTVNNVFIPAMRSMVGVAQRFIDRYVTVDNTVLALASSAGILAGALVGLFNPFSVLGGTLAPALALGLDKAVYGVVSLLAGGQKLVGLLKLVGSAIKGVVVRIATLSMSGIVGTVVGSLGKLRLALTGLTLKGVLGSVVAGFKAVVGILTASGGVSGALMSLTGPVGIAIGTAIALYGAWKTNFLGIRDLTNRVISGIKTTLSGDMSAIQSTIDITTSAIRSLWNNRLQPMWQTAKRVFGQIRTVVTNVMNWIHKTVIQPALAGITDLFNTHGAEIVNEVRETFQAVRGYITTVINFITPFLKGAAGTMIGIWNRWGDEIMAVVEFTMDTIGHIVKITTDALVTAFLVALNLIQGDVGEAMSEIKGFFSRTLNEILGLVKKWGGRLVSYIGDIVGDIIGWFEDLYNDLIGNSIIPDMLSDIITAVENWDLVGAVSDVINDVLQTVENLASDFTEAGEGLIDAFAEGIENAAGKATDAVEGVVDDVSSYLPGSDAETGPLDHITDQGAGLPEAVATGMEKNVRVVGQAAETVAQNARPQLNAEEIGPISDASGGGTTYNIKVDARGADNPTDVKRNAERGLTSALKSQNVGR